MAKNSQNDDRLVTTPIDRLYEQVLAPERHDFFLSALTFVHKNKQLTKKEAEAVAYLMMQTGDPSDNFHGWVRLAIWSRYYGSKECRQVLSELKAIDALTSLCAKYKVVDLKSFRSSVQNDAEVLGWNRKRFYSVGSSRKADRTDNGYDGYGGVAGQCNLVEGGFALLPVGHAASEQAVEGRGVVVVLEVAELVHDDVVDAVDGHLDEVESEGYPTFAAATPPTGTHFP